MKPSKNSFLFFCLIIKFGCIVFTASAQSVEDSIINNYRNLILKPNDANELTKGYNYFIKSKEINLKKHDTIKAIYDLRLIAIGLKKKGLFYDSEDYAVEALSLLDNMNINDSVKLESLIALYNHLGLIYTEIDDYDKAINYFNKVIDISDNVETKNTGIKNRSNVYFERKDYNEAIEGYLSVLDYSLENEDKVKIARLKDNLGFAQSKVNDPKALINLQQALDIRVKEDHYSGMITSFLYLGEYYKEKNKIKEALEFANKALTIARKTNNKYYILNTLSFKISLNDNSEIIEYQKLSDSISLDNKLFENKFAATRYDYFKEKQRADLNEIQREKEKRRKVIAFSITAFIALFSAFLYLILKSRHKREKLRQVYVTESRISKKVHDDIANDVFQVMTALQTNDDLNQTIKDDIEHIYDKARDISKQFREIDLKGDYKIILNDLALRYNAEDTNVILKDVSKIAWDKISKTKKTALYKALQELLINMKKHSKASIVVITFINKSKNVGINYSDDGIGCDLKKSNGLLNVENRIKAVGGSINFEAIINNGFKAKIQI